MKYSDVSNQRSAASVNEAGFTLVELVITILVLGAMAAALSSFFISIKSIQAQAGYLADATQAAQREIESLRNGTYSSLTDGQTIDFTNQLPSTLPAGRSGTVTVSVPSSSLRRVDVVVSYTYGGEPHKVELSSLLGEIGIVQ